MKGMIEYFVINSTKTVLWPIRKGSEGYGKLKRMIV